MNSPLTPPSTGIMLPLAHCSAVLLDLDGTLVDTVPDFEIALGKMLALFDRPPVDAAFIARTVGKGTDYLVQQTLHYAGVDETHFTHALSAYLDIYSDINGQYARPYSGVIEGLAYLRAAGLPLACVTNKPKRAAIHLLHTLGLHDHFAWVFGGDDFARKKPDPMPVLEACKALHVEPASCLMIGDSINDAQAARAAGCPIALVRYGYNHGNLIESVDADAYLDSLAELPTLIMSADCKD